MERFAREDVRQVLGRYGIASAQRAADTDESEEIILLDEPTYKQIHIDGLTRAMIVAVGHIQDRRSGQHHGGGCALLNGPRPRRSSNIVGSSMLRSADGGTTWTDLDPVTGAASV
jgi:hypothetical protein